MAGKKEVKIWTVKDLEEEFGVKGKIIRRHLRKMEENIKPRGPQRYEWKETDPKFKKIRKKLAETFTTTKDEETEQEAEGN